MVVVVVVVVVVGRSGRRHCLAPFSLAYQRALLHGVLSKDGEAHSSDKAIAMTAAHATPRMLVSRYNFHVSCQLYMQHQVCTLPFIALYINVSLTITNSLCLCVFVILFVVDIFLEESRCLPLRSAMLYETCHCCLAEVRAYILHDSVGLDGNSRASCYLGFVLHWYPEPQRRH